MRLQTSPVRRSAVVSALATLATAASVVVALPPSPATGAPAAAVTDGSARFEVLTPTLIRTEYAGDGVFTDATTFNAVNRSFTPPPYTTTVTADGYREIRTSALTLRYKQNSGPFTASNLSVAITATGTTARPAFPSYCPVSVACEGENALLTGNATPAYDHKGYTGTGFASGYERTGSGVQYDVDVPSVGTWRLAVRYANATGSDGQSATRTLTAHVNGNTGPRFSLPPTGSWDTWSTASVDVGLRAGVNTITVAEDAGDSGRVNIDSLAVTPTTATGYPAPATDLRTTGYGAGPADQLGGWYRSLDNLPDGLPDVGTLHPGLLDRGGWYLLDDTRTALLGANHTVGDRPSHGAQPYQDGYFFGYGQNYKQALSDLGALTGGADLLPQTAYGVWFSRFWGYSTSDYQNTLLPAFRRNFVPIDWLVVDTDWKKPVEWDGWNWNTDLFPDPQAFLDWTKQMGLDVSLNVHPEIDDTDPRFPAANTAAGGLPVQSDGHTHYFDWSNPAHLAAYQGLHAPFEQQGVRAWWLDYCGGCGASIASDPHVAPDNLINQAYADHDTGRGLRGFAFSRIGGTEHGGLDATNFAVGPWSERRNTLAFTGDTYSTWDTLAYEVRFTAGEAAAGLTGVTHDIGGFHGGHLADDMYARWVQFGTFQPVLRLHSDHGDRLPWDYPGAAQSAAQRFLRLREALVPYTYTMAWQAARTGVPIVRPMYLDYPAADAAYSASGEYMYGDDLLVAPVTTPNDANGDGSVSVWVPPGTWSDYFTGATYTGPATVTMTAPLSRMPVLVKAGGLVPLRTDYVNGQKERPAGGLTVDVTAGADGSFSLYGDAGEGNGYASGQFTTTPLSWADGSRTFTVGASTGGYPGAPTTRAYTLRVAGSAAPTAVLIDGVQVPETAWAYNRNSRTVTVTTDGLSTGTAHTVTLTGSAADNPGTGEVVGVGGLCLDVRGGVDADGQPVQVYTCNHTTAQQADHAGDDTVRLLSRCLTAGGTANGAPVTIASCNGAPGQSWTRRADGTLLNPGSGRCLDVPNSNPTPGAAQLQLYDCLGTDGQIWRLPPGPVTGPGGLCADVADADPSSAGAVQLYTCNGTDAQRWSTPGDGTVRVFGKCLDVSHGATADGTPVQLFDCNGTGSQKWTSRSDGTLYNPQSGRCLDDPGNRQRPGDALQIYACNTSTAQQFRLG
ncbi:ricin-type beta-trefoil lectin domain protein [Actinoallomurus soli]|uniref:ricin-type beta-trefoil lectin domain protein n=1 Tax=Actinoallomurus soli TaxID=2952535 RepID=UPI0020923334|nr:ricin-type beta-trefoil lectin domain protein [Actinoallomurus soli]MCO5974073.1 ricin-type beta-trefoil lectin domain protein [Actinoallomurus soli]